MKKILFCLIAALFAYPSFAQENENKSVVKLNLSALAYKSYSFQYEMALAKNMSVACGLRLTPNIGFPKRITALDSTGELAKIGIKGWAFTPEFRFYPGKKEKKQAPRGFYLAPYLRYTHFATNIPVTINDSITGAHTFSMTGNINALTLGFMIGAQWIIKDRVSIDWWILGGSTGSYKSTFEIEADLKGVPQSERTKWENDIQTTVSQLPGVSSVEGKVYDTKLTVDVKGKLAGVRSGVCIGFAF